MNFKLMDSLEVGSREMRSAFCETLCRLAEENESIVVLDADLMVAMGTLPFRDAFPDRTVDLGVMEANMMGVAAGMSVAGAIPFAHTFAVFASRRAYDQVFLSGAYQRSNVKIVGSDPGITAAMNGGTHMAFEDMGLMCAIPTMTVVEPTDISMLKNLMPQMAAQYGMFYMRLVRSYCVDVYREDSTFEIGKGNILVDFPEGKTKDVTIIASGYCVAEALKAAEYLRRQHNIFSRVIDMFTWKPIDRALILNSAKLSGAIVTAENHRVTNGLGAAVAQVLSQEMPTPLEMVGVGADEFGEVGSVDYLSKRFGLNADSIVAAVQTVLERKNK